MTAQILLPRTRQAVRRRALMISIAGKGGVGKTTLTALMLKVLLESTRKLILVVDADPVSNLPSVLGVKEYTTVGDVIEELREKMERGEVSSIPPEVFDMYVQDTIVECDNFDLLVMGRTEGKGCYCYVNAVLRGIIQTLESNYDIILIDCEAGLEHIQRRVDENVDILLIVTDSSRMGIEACRKIVELSEKLGLNIGRKYVVGNKVTNIDALRRALSDIGVDLCGIIPYDPLVEEYNLAGKSLLEIPDDSPALQAVREICRRIGLI